MTWYRRVTWCAGTLFFVFAALSSTLHAKPDKGDDKKSLNYYPLQVGNQWSFKISVGENSANAVSRISKMEAFPPDNQELARLEASVNNSVVAVEHLKQKDDGVYRYRNN